LAAAECDEVGLAEDDGRAVVVGVGDGDGELLRYLTKLKLIPGSRLEVRELAPFDGPVTVRIGGADHAISRDLAAQISVS